MKIFGWIDGCEGTQDQAFDLPDTHPIAVLLKQGNDEIVLHSDGMSNCHYRREPAL